MTSKLVFEILIKRYDHFQFLTRFQPREKNLIAAANRAPKKLFFDNGKISRIWISGPKSLDCTKLNFSHECDVKNVTSKNELKTCLGALNPKLNAIQIFDRDDDDEGAKNCFKIAQDCIMWWS